MRCEKIMTNVTVTYRRWLNELKQHIHSTQINAALKVNEELIALYWHLGLEILDKEKNTSYGTKLIDQLSKDLIKEFPQVKGFSRTNLYLIRQWVFLYAQKDSIVHPAGGQLPESGKELIKLTDKQPPEILFQIPWKHHKQIIAKCTDPKEALFYISAAAKYNWSNTDLVHQIESKLFQRQGRAITNFEQTLPAIHSDLAREVIKDPYAFDFLSLRNEHKERELESALMDNLTRFLLELGAGFCFVGRQYPIKVGDKEFAIDLLFYHYKLRCFVVIELKATEFRAEYTGKLNFYLNVVDDKLKPKEDNPTLGILICKQRNEIITEYALQGINKPIGVSEYLSGPLPENIKDWLPTIQQIEEQLSDLE